MVKVKFKQRFFYRDAAGAHVMCYPEDQLPDGHDGIYEFEDDFPLPTLDIEIVSGQSTYKKPIGVPPELVTEIKASAKVRPKKTATAAAEEF